MSVDECIKFYLDKGHLPDSNKPDEARFYNFIYKQIIRNGKKLPQLIEQFKKLGVDILNEIQVGKQKKKSTKHNVVRYYDTNPNLAEKLNIKKIQNNSVNQLINKQNDLIEKLLSRVETLKFKNTTLKTKLEKMSKMLNETNEEVGLYKLYCKDITHIKWD